MLRDIERRYGPAYFRNEYLPAVGVRDGRVDLEVYDRHYWPMLQLLRREAPPPSRLLEVGAAAGLFLKAAQRAGWDVVGIEDFVDTLGDLVWMRVRDAGRADQLVSVARAR